MAVQFKIPKLTDREIIATLGRIRAELKPQRHFKFLVQIPHGSEVELPDEKPEEVEKLRFVIDLNSQLIDSFRFVDPNGREAFAVRREWGKVIDSAAFNDEWRNYADEGLRAILPQLYVKLLSQAQNELKAPDAIAALEGRGDDDWNRYRDAQTAVINSLQQTMECLLIKTADRNAELDRTRSEKFEKLEADLRGQLEKEREGLLAKATAHQEELATRDKALEVRAAEFNTKEARYVARKKQEEQIEQVKGWISDWNLTKGTTQKRYPILAAYIVAIICTGGLTAFYAYSNYSIFASTPDISKLVWWQWAALSAKVFFPFAAFTTFLIYLIRWESSWARQHSEEEFRNRNRLVDLGRSSWLLEAVRDTENGGAIPPDLLKELSRNLFTNSVGEEADIHPTAISDVLLQGLASLRFKAPDGSEIEATRGKGK